MPHTHEVPKFLYHGAFWPLNLKLNPLNGLMGHEFLSASEDLDYATYFARLRRRTFQRHSGQLLIFSVDTSKLSEEMRGQVIAPYEDGSRVLGSTYYNQAWINERVDLKEWNFIHPVPWSALNIVKSMYLR